MKCGVSSNLIVDDSRCHLPAPMACQRQHNFATTTSALPPAKMAELLAESIAKLNIDAAPHDTEDDSWIDSILDHAPPRKRVKQDPDELCKQLEQKYLTPSTSFSQAWLNKLQRYVLLE